MDEDEGAPDRPEVWNPYRQYRASLLSPDRVRELSRLRPMRAVIDTIVCWAWIVGAWALVALHPAWWTVLLAIPVIGTRYYALFVIGHDGMHRRVFPRQPANDLFTDLAILGPIGAITRINNHNHLQHHKYLATESDPDRHKHACFNKATRPQYLVFLTGLANVWPVVRHVFFRAHDAGAHAAGPRRNNAYTLRDVTILVGWQAALIGGLTWSIGWWAFPVLWLLPVYIFLYLGDLVRSFLEHSHPEADAKADAHRLITYTSNAVERALFAPMNMNYHATHHLWVSIPYYNLPIADREIRERPESEGLVWRGSYVAYLLRYYLALPLPECQKPRAT
jgi:fatty acid desaturase